MFSLFVKIFIRICRNSTTATDASAATTNVTTYPTHSPEPEFPSQTTFAHKGRNDINQPLVLFVALVWLLFYVNKS